MRISEILSEATRSAKELVGNEGALTWIQQNIPKEDYDQYGVSLTVVNKLGVNPKSTFTTPLGIYFYPLSYYVSEIEEGRRMPFPDSPRYIQIFRINADPSTVIDLWEVTEADVADLISRSRALFQKIHNKFPEVGYSVGEMNHKLDEYIEFFNSREQLKKNSGLQFWNLLQQLSKIFDWTSMNRRRYVKHMMADRDIVLWNWTIRQMGITAFRDRDGIIHENEPVQGVIINPSVAELVRTISADTSKRLPLPQENPGDTPGQTLLKLLEKYYVLKNRHWTRTQPYYQKFSRYLAHRLRQATPEQTEILGWSELKSLLTAVDQDKKISPELFDVVVKLAANAYRDYYTEVEGSFLQRMSKIQQRLNTQIDPQDVQKLKEIIDAFRNFVLSEKIVFVMANQSTRINDILTRHNQTIRQAEEFYRKVNKTYSQVQE
jgi:nicotinamide mononucleotide adenylyltransferase